MPFDLYHVYQPVGGEVNQFLGLSSGHCCLLKSSMGPVLSRIFQRSLKLGEFFSFAFELLISDYSALQ